MKTYKQANQPITPGEVVNYLKALLLGALCVMVFIISTDLNCRNPKILEPVPPSMYNRTTPTLTPTITTTPTPKKKAIVPFKKYLTAEAAQIRELILPKIQSEYDEVNALAFDNILKKEAGYRPDAINEIGAGGMPQALPASKMGCPIEATTEAALCQYEWMKKYIENRYGTPEKAWEFHLAKNWY